MAGTKPNTGTPADRRLKENRHLPPRPAKPKRQPAAKPARRSSKQ